MISNLTSQTDFDCKHEKDIIAEQSQRRETRPEKKGNNKREHFEGSDTSTIKQIKKHNKFKHQEDVQFFGKNGGWFIQIDDDITFGEFKKKVHEKNKCEPNCLKKQCQKLYIDDSDSIQVQVYQAGKLIKSFKSKKRQSISSNMSMSQSTEIYFQSPDGLVKFQQQKDIPRIPRVGINCIALHLK